MSWRYSQQGRQTYASTQRGVHHIIVGGDGSSGSGILGKLSMSLDAISYIIAFFLVDIFTFGRPLVVHTTPMLEKQEHPIDTFIDSHAGRRSASEGDAVINSKPSSPDHISRRSSNYSDSSAASHKLHRYDSLSPDRHSHREDYKDGALHHNQKAIFERQMRKTLLVQPFVKCLLISLYLVGCFIVVAHFFGLPKIVQSALDHLQSSTYSLAVFVEAQVVRLYNGVLTILPIRGRERTGWDVLKATWNRFWLQILAHLESYRR